MATTTDIKNLIINKVESQTVFDYMLANGLVSEDELYLIQGEDNAILFTPQTLTDEQIAQVKVNLNLEDTESIENKVDMITANATDEQYPSAKATRDFLLDNSAYVTPEMYGAVGNGTTDDTVAIQAAINASVGENKIVYLYKKTYATTAPLVFNTGLTKFICDGIIKYSGTEQAILVTGRNIRINIERIDAENGTALELKTVNNTISGCDIRIHGIYSSVIGIRLFTNTDYAIYYNKISCDNINATNKCIELWADSKYINENTIFPGQMSQAQYGIYIHSNSSLNVGGGYGVNDTTFHYGAFEGMQDSATAIYLDGTSGNRFNTLRCQETYGSTIISFNGYCSENDICLSGLRLNQIDISNIGDGSVKNYLRATKSFYAGGYYIREVCVNAECGITYAPINTTVQEYITSSANTAIGLNSDNVIINHFIFGDEVNGQSYILNKIYSDDKSMAKGTPITITFGTSGGKIILTDCLGNIIIDNSNGVYSGHTISIQWAGYDTLENKNIWHIEASDITDDDIQTVNGKIININDATSEPLVKANVYGISTQNAVPDVSTSVEIISSGHDGDINISVYGKNLFKLPPQEADSSTSRISSATVVEYLANGDIIQGNAGSTPGTNLASNGWYRPGRVYKDKAWSEYRIDIPKGYIITISADITLLETYEGYNQDFHLYLGTDSLSNPIITAKTYTLNVGETTHIARSFTATMDYVNVYPIFTLHSCKMKFENIQIEVGTVNSEYENYIDKKSIVIPISDTLKGIPVESGGNYTDDSGQRWICDEIDFGRGILIRRIAEISSYASEDIGSIWMSSTGALTSGANVLYVMNTPTETALSNDIVNAFNTLYLNEPNSVIMSQDNVYISVTYSKKEVFRIINKKIEEHNVSIDAHTDIRAAIAAVDESAESVENKTNAITADVTNEQYPTVAAVKHYVDNQISDNVENHVEYIPSQTLRVGNNILTDDIVTLGAGWSGSLAEGFTHASGNTEPLVFAIGAADGELYLVDGMDSGYNQAAIALSLGNSPTSEPYDGTPKIQWGLICVGDNGALKIIPTSGYTGKITGLMCRKISNEGENEVEITLGDIQHMDNPNHLTGFWNIAMGGNALENSVNGTRNIAIGKSSLAALKSGGRNIGLGTYTLSQMEKGENNIAIGADAGLELDESSTNVMIGKSAMYYGKNTECVAIGLNALKGGAATAANGVLAIGTGAGYSGGGTSNVFVGKEAGYRNTGNLNTFVGQQAGVNATSWGCVAIGAQADTQGYSQSIAIGRQAKATKSTQAVLGSDAITETLLKGNLVVRGTDGKMRQIVFDENGLATWLEDGTAVDINYLNKSGWTAGSYLGTNDEGTVTEKTSVDIGNEIVNLYVWEKYNAQPGTAVLEDKKTITLASHTTISDTTTKIVYADSYSVVDGEIILNNPSDEIYISSSQANANTANNTFKRKYIKVISTTKSSALGTTTIGTPNFYYVGTDAEAVYKTLSESVSINSNITMSNVQPIRMASPISYLTSVTDNAYPTNAADENGYWYVRGNKLGALAMLTSAEEAIL